MERLVRILATTAAYFASLVAIAVTTFFVVIFLAGPHAGLLPSWLEAADLGIGWLVVVVLPLMLATKVWRRLGKSIPGKLET